MSLQAPLVPLQNSDLHFVLCNFGRAGCAYVETDPNAADERTIARNLMEGQYGTPQQVIALNPAEGWCRDVSEDIARTVLQLADAEQDTLPDGTRDFVEKHLGVFLAAA